MIPSVSANVNVGAVTTPSTHTAWVTVGATGVTSSHDVPTSSTVNVAVVGSTQLHPSRHLPPLEPVDHVAVTVTVAVLRAVTEPDGVIA